MPKKGSRSRSKTTKKGTSRKGVRRRTWDPVEYSEKIVPIVASMLGLDTLGLDEASLQELLRDIIVQIIGDRVTKPKPETIVNAIRRNQDKIYPLLALRLLDIVKVESVNREQLEFILSYIGPLVIHGIHKLLEIVKKVDPSRMEELRRLWEIAWAQRNEGPIGVCPRCGFKAITPEGACMVCGHMLSDKELKSSVEFDVKFKEFLEEASCEDLKKAIESMRLFVGQTSATVNRTSSWDIEIFLNKDEMKRIKDVYLSRCKALAKGDKKSVRSQELVIKEILSKL